MAILSDDDLAMFGEPPAHDDVLPTREPSPAPVDHAGAAKAARIAAAKAELAALESEAFEPVPPPKKARIVIDDRAFEPVPPPQKSRIVIDDKTTPDQISDSRPTIDGVCDGCSSALTPDNASRLSSGVVKHIGCPAIVPPDAPKSVTALASAQPAVVVDKPKRGRPAKAQIEIKIPDAVNAEVPASVAEPEAQSVDVPVFAPLTVKLEITPETIAALESVLGEAIRYFFKIQSDAKYISIGQANAT